MGYACPVCSTPQADAEHLANHLAFTAMLGREDHESWLDEHAPGWDEDGPETLGDRVAEHAAETEYEEVFEDTTHDHGEMPFEEQLERQVGGGRGRRRSAGTGRGSLAGDAEQILSEARQMTERMLDEGDGDKSNTGDAAGSDGGESDPEEKA